MSRGESHSPTGRDGRYTAQQSIRRASLELSVYVFEARRTERRLFRTADFAWLTLSLHVSLHPPRRYCRIRSDVVEGRWRYTGSEGRGTIVDALAEKLNARLREWKPETAAEARERIAEVIELADQGILDIARSRAAEQEVLDLLDEPPTR